LDLQIISTVAVFITFLSYGFNTTFDEGLWRYTGDFVVKVISCCIINMAFTTEKLKIGNGIIFNTL
jgi:hypothetical protein